MRVATEILLVLAGSKIEIMLVFAGSETKILLVSDILILVASDGTAEIRVDPRSKT